MSDDLIAEALTEHWGPRCPVKDIDDVPLEIDGKPVGRCPCCLAWEQYDRLRASGDGVIDREFAEMRFKQARDADAAELSRLRAEAERLKGALEGALADSARLTLALADERRHADALADTLYSMDGLQKIDCEMRDNAVQQHRARRQG